MTQQKGNILPTIGRVVHYVSHGSADGTYPSVCRAAVVAEIPDSPDSEHRVNLCVLNPTGIFFGQHPHAEAEEMKGGTWHWPCETRRVADR